LKQFSRRSTSFGEALQRAEMRVVEVSPGGGMFLSKRVEKITLNKIKELVGFVVQNRDFNDWIRVIEHQHSYPDEPKEKRDINEEKQLDSPEASLVSLCWIRV
jgi:hypothetical protein